MDGSIHPTAIIAATAKIHPQTTIMPYSYIGEDVIIDQGCEIGPHSIIKGPTAIGKNNRIFQFTSIGEECQHIDYRGERTTLVIGDDNIFRESCTVHRGTVQGGGKTVIGNSNLFLVNVHIAHDCIIGDNNILVNNTSLGGHVHIGNHAILGGHTGVHQYCRIGDHAFIGRCAMVVQDIPPFTKSAGNVQKLYGLNTTGLKRKGFDTKTIQAIKKAYHLYYHSSLGSTEALNSQEMQRLHETFPAVKIFSEFIRSSQRGVLR